MRPFFSLLGLSLLFFTSAGSALGDSVQASGLSISDAGRSAAGKPLYNLNANGADMIDVLKQLFAKAGVGAYEISPEIRGSVTLNVKGATADELIDQLRRSTNPPISIVTNGRTVYASRSSSALAKAEEIRRRMEGNQFNRMAPGIVPNGLRGTVEGGYRDLAALDTPVSLNVPDEDPITLRAALQLLEKQSRVPIRLDPSLPADIKFTGTVTKVPLWMVLQNIAPGNGEGLKVVQTANQILIAPADKFNIFLNNAAISSMSPCPKCHQSLLSTWSFCPNCGQATKRGQLQGYPSANGKRPLPRPE